LFFHFYRNKDHSAYFETVIKQCGLTTKNTVIVLAITSNHVRLQQCVNSRSE